MSGFFLHVSNPGEKGGTIKTPVPSCGRDVTEKQRHDLMCMSVPLYPLPHDGPSIPGLSLSLFFLRIPMVRNILVLVDGDPGWCVNE